jgi:hypothetical protein
MAVSGGYAGALAWMLAHGWTKADLDQFLAGNPGDWGRVDTAFGNDTPPSSASNSGSSGTALIAQQYPTVAPPQYAPPQYAAPAYATPTPMQAGGDLTVQAASDATLTAHPMLTPGMAPAAPFGGSSPISISTPGSSGGGLQIPTWAYVAAAALLLLVLVRR